MPAGLGRFVRRGTVFAGGSRFHQQDHRVGHGRSVRVSARARRNRTGPLLRIGPSGHAIGRHACSRDRWRRLIDGEVEIVVRRVDNVTYYECSVPWREMKQVLQPAEGREICFSLLVHDPDGTGLRDWGDSAGSWESQRTWLGWSKWPGANRGPHNRPTTAASNGDCVVRDIDVT